MLFDEEGNAKIADFGIARIVGGETLTDPGTVLGTAAYISPEQAAGHPATPASDVYSFGVILYRMLTGRLPFEADDGRALVALHLREPPPPISETRRDAPAALAGLALRALAKDPAERPDGGAALLRELGLPAPLTWPVAAETAVLRSARGSRSPTRALGFAAGVLVLASAGVGLALVTTGGDDRRQSGTSSRQPPTTASGTTVAPPSATEPTTTAATTDEATTSQATTTEPAATTTAPPTTATEPGTTTEPPPTTTEPPPTTTEPPPTTTEPPPPSTEPGTTGDLP